MTPEAARAILDLRIDDRDRERMDELLQIRQEGTLLDEDQADLDSYLEVGRFLDLLRVEALGSLKKTAQDFSARVDD